MVDDYYQAGCQRAVDEYFEGPEGEFSFAKRSVSTSSSDERLIWMPWNRETARWLN